MKKTDFGNPFIGTIVILGLALIVVMNCRESGNHVTTVVTDTPTPVLTATIEPSPGSSATPTTASTATPEATPGSRASLRADFMAPVEMFCEDQVTLDGRASVAENGIASIKWAISGGIILSGESTLTPRFQAPSCSEGPFPITIDVSLTIGDRSGLYDTTTKQITVTGGTYKTKLALALRN